jgi:hypothetical protein
LKIEDGMLSIDNLQSSIVNFKGVLAAKFL